MSPIFGWEAKETHILPFPEVDAKVTQDDNDTPSAPHPEISFGAHSALTPSVDAYYPTPKWRLGPLYPNAPTTFSGCTPEKRKFWKDHEDFSPACSEHSPPPKKRRVIKDPEGLSPPTSPCELIPR